MITWDHHSRIVHLKTCNMSYILHLGEEVRGLYWGAPVDPDDFDPAAVQVFHSSFDVDTGMERSEYAVDDGQHFAQLCLQLEDALGLQTCRMRYQAHSITDETLDITFVEPDMGVELMMTYRLYPQYDILARSAKLTNKADTQVKVRRFLSGCAVLPFGFEGEVRYVSGKWAGENRLISKPVGEGVFSLESRRGFSGTHSTPALALGKGADEDHGAVYFGVLAYSGNWRMEVEKTPFGHTRLLAGRNDFDAAECLAPGESLATPAFYLGFSQGGYGDMSRTLHRFGQQVVMNRNLCRRVLYNSWEATAFHVEVNSQKELAKCASEMGVELFVIDDGWFGARDSDKAGLGDWVVNAQKFPNGLEELTDYVISLGMGFGIWVEPESVNPDSDLYRAHPDWIYHIPSREPALRRNQYLLNLSLPAVQEYLMQSLRRLLQNKAITFLKWDMNRPITDWGLDPSQWRKHTEALYDLWEMIRMEFPHVELECCAGGGGRVDFGALHWADEFWPSDNTDPYERLFIQEGYTQFYPPCAMMCWVTDTPKNAFKAGRDSLRYKFHVAMQGGLGIGADISKFTNEEAETCKQYINQYKNIREVVQRGTLYRLRSPHEHDFSAVSYVSQDQQSAIVFGYMIGRRFGDPLPWVCLKGLSPHDRYLVDGQQSVSGLTLMNAGLQLNLQGDFDSCVIVLRREA